MPFLQRSVEVLKYLDLTPRPEVKEKGHSVVGGILYVLYVERSGVRERKKREKNEKKC